jgi:undecaprenyl-phosphate 4-deoxy-4-formamido-L-arabinose transferase
VKHDPRQLGQSGYTLGRLIAHAMNMMTGFSTLPLQVASIVGFAFTLFGMCTLLYVLVRYLLHGVAVQGFAFLASLISIFSGAQLFALGVMGEYLSRMHFRMMERPPYAVRAKTYED